MTVLGVATAEPIAYAGVDWGGTIACLDVGDSDVVDLSSDSCSESGAFRSGFDGSTPDIVVGVGDGNGNDIVCYRIGTGINDCKEAVCEIVTGRVCAVGPPVEIKELAKVQLLQ